jgi:predicted nucleic acid-binding protein
MPIVIADASPLVALSLIDRLEWLPKLFGTVYVVQAVMQEVLTNQFALSESNIRAAVRNGWLEVVESVAPVTVDFVSRQISNWKQLDAGEAQSIAYAHALSHNALLLIDERAGRVACAELGLATLGTAGIVRLAKEHQLIPLVKPELARLHEAGFWLTPEVTKSVLKRAGELS